MKPEVDKHGNCSACGGIHYGTGNTCAYKQNHLEQKSANTEARAGGELPDLTCPAIDALISKHPESADALESLRAANSQLRDAAWHASIFAEDLHASEVRSAALARQVEELTRERAQLRARLFSRHQSTACGSHTTACSIWGDDGQGHTEEGYAEPLPCNCGALQNYAESRAERAEAQLATAREAVSQCEARLRQLSRGNQGDRIQYEKMHMFDRAKHKNALEDAYANAADHVKAALASTALGADREVSDDH